MKNTAKLYRMETSQHICPFGLKSKDLLQRKGFIVEDHKLASRQETDEFKKLHDVKTTPQTFINGERVGGYDDLRAFFGMSEPGQQGKTYTPVIAIFAVAALLAVALAYPSLSIMFSIETLMLFVAFSMAILAVQKLRDLYSFSNSFITYDLLAMRVVPYAYVYPFLEAFVGIGMVANLPTLMIAPISLLIGGIGAVSVFKAVYIDKRDLKCACVGGKSDVPLGAVSLTENLFMIAAGLWMLTL
ncbi:glutaredoxin domain-containing protein [Aliiglaciecola sp. 2_MG-2023]|uniref:MauE/DoxX family redox-associated membrane protein n=1 Tax=unclassified Aliiglaciecola TaxID=2593648 RepID=UPI0026E126EF|nr:MULTISPECIES: MauE/DoxX family redox-associated membrane protein [unclassified Aliiglaciecola]MDO6712711.1 glutaredoxin domain-containing protein [Aliiglaciecola sp. 2_MG-2023]MDO6752904.1 glutaredoxin domain-containing protein [Aliiglaciecola sp. 1_MG-2023]